MPIKINYKFQEIDYPKEMDNFINDWLIEYDYNSKAIKIEALTMFKKVITDLLNIEFKPPSEYKYMNDLPIEQKILAIKCLGHNIGVWDLHMYYNEWFL